MRALALNHVSIPSPDPDASARWWQEVFEMDELPSPNFGFAVRWLRLGDLELHFFESHGRPEPGQHFGIVVDDYEEAYRRLKAIEARDEGTRFAFVYELPGGEVQMYFRDPFGNLVEIDHPDLSSLDRSVFGDDLKVLADEQPQDGENLKARLFLKARATARV
jgi:catechol 2,3-dioxygenase-like lactoylglutathione lyase family enzyme